MVLARAECLVWCRMAFFEIFEWVGSFDCVVLIWWNCCLLFVLFVRCPVCVFWCFVIIVWWV